MTISAGEAKTKMLEHLTNLDRVTDFADQFAVFNLAAKAARIRASFRAQRMTELAAESKVAAETAKADALAAAAFAQHAAEEFTAVLASEFSTMDVGLAVELAAWVATDLRSELAARSPAYVTAIEASELANKLAMEAVQEAEYAAKFAADAAEATTIVYQLDESVAAAWTEASTMARQAIIELNQQTEQEA